MSEHPITVIKRGALIPVSRELLLDHGLAEPTPEEQAETERRAAERIEQGTAYRQQLAALTDPTARAILDLHKETGHGECGGCDIDGYEAEAPTWPCRTVETIAALNKIG